MLERREMFALLAVTHLRLEARELGFLDMTGMLHHGLPETLMQHDART